MGIGNNIPPPADAFDWQTICNLNNMNTIGQQLPPSIATPATNRKRKQQQSEDDEEDMYTKRRKLNGQTTKIKQETKIKKEKKTKKKKKRKKKSYSDNHSGDDSNDEMNSIYNHHLYKYNAADSFVGIRTKDGEVRIQIPRGKVEGDSIKSNRPKVDFSVFGHACSDKIEDILQAKKRTRYVRGLSEEEKKTRRREQNRNAAARSRARKNAMISKVIQLHQENMGLRAFVAENITQTKYLRDEVNRLSSMLIQQQHQLVQQQPTQTMQEQQPTQSSLFD